MKSILLIIGAGIILLHSCKTPTPKRELYNQDFKWKITIPENFDSLGAEQWAKMQNRGAAAIEKATDVEIENRAKTIFVFKSDQLNYFESNWQPFDTLQDGNYEETSKGVNDLLYQTFTQMPGTKTDTSTSKETIDGLAFHVFNMEVTYPNKMVLYGKMFTRLFDKKEFSVNIMYVDKAKGDLMLTAWRNSKFDKN